MSEKDDVLIALAAIRVAGPVLLLALLTSVIPLKPPPAPEDIAGITSVVVATPRPRRGPILFILSLAALTYLLDAILLIILAVVNHAWQGTTKEFRGVEVADVIGFLAFSGLAIVGSFKHAKGASVWTRNRVKTFAGFAVLFDIAQVVLLAVGVKIFPGPGTPQYPGSSNGINVPSFLHLLFTAIRLLVLLPLLPILSRPRTEYSSYGPSGFTPIPPSENNLIEASGSIHSPTPASGLLQPKAGPSTLAPYGTFSNSHTPVDTRTHTPAPTELTHPNGVHHAPAPLKPTKKEVNLEPSWSELGSRLRKLVPYLWPTKSFKLQFLAMLCIILLLIGRVVNYGVPTALARTVSVFEHPGTGSPWPPLFVYIGLRFLQSSGGLPALRDVLWAPVMQFSDRQMSQLSFDHLLNLSLAFHTRRKTGEILRILDRGAAINHIFEMLLFNIVPTVLDIIVALFVFYFQFGPILSLVIFVVMISYISASIVLTTWRTKLRRQMTDRDVVTRGIHTDCLLNYETVKYFGGEAHEGARYRDAIAEYQTLEYKVMASLNLLNLVQNFIISSGLLAGSVIVARQVLDPNDDADASKFVFFITYLAQLYGPLTQLGYIYRQINQNLVDTERLMLLLSEPTDINDKPGAPDLVIKDGEIEFDNVSFSYDDRVTALNGISFKVPKGSSVALVGESGSGKSTILRLLYRFYDLKPGEGRILIDGQDIRDVTQASLRRAIGVVPQDSVLFNSSIGYNIGYGRFGASQTEIETAARLAQMHERIIAFPDGYETKVGERGVRLSGGEKQRVAIARTLLKDPSIIALDEATSALDTTTEKDIQRALQELVRGRSSLSIAHRLSTIAASDIILVIRDGQIAEAGSHRELLAQDGIFAAMWAEQVSADDDFNLSNGHADKKPLIDLEEPIPQGYVVDAPEPSGSKALDEAQEDLEVAAISPQLVEEDVFFKVADEMEAPANPFADTLPVTDSPGHLTPAIPHANGSTKDLHANGSSRDLHAKDPSIIDAPGPAPASTTDHHDYTAPAPAPPAPDVAPDAAPLSFPTTSDDAPITFPADTDAQAPQSNIHFGEDVPATAPEIDEGTKSKRKRTASQNFQKLARKITLGGKKDKDKPASEQQPEAPIVPADITTEELLGVSPEPNDDSPLSFPGGANDSTTKVSTPGSITFASDEPPSGGAPPDGEEKVKRKRISSQNFQRLVKRVSVNVQRRGSSSSGGFGSDDKSDKATTPKKEPSGGSFFARIAKSEGGTPRASREEPSGATGSYREGSIQGGGDSPAASILGDGTKKEKRKGLGF